MGVGFRVLGLGFRVLGLVLGSRAWLFFKALGFRVLGSPGSLQCWGKSV